MLTKNFTGLTIAAIDSHSASANYDIKEISGVTTSQNMNNILFTGLGSSFSTATYVSGNFGTYLMIGSGDSAATADDIQLASPIAEANFTRTSATKTYTSDKKLLLQTTFAWIGAETEIKEIGLMVTWNTHTALLAREVLDSPITVNNGDTFTVSMAIG